MFRIYEGLNRVVGCSEAYTSPGLYETGVGGGAKFLDGDVVFVVLELGDGFVVAAEVVAFEMDEGIAWRIC